MNIIEQLIETLRYRPKIKVVTCPSQLEFVKPIVEEIAAENHADVEVEASDFILPGKVLIIDFSKMPGEDRTTINLPPLANMAGELARWITSEVLP